MVRTIILSCALMLPVLAFAQTAAPVPAKDPVKIEKLCQQLVEHQPAADVEYKPGTDQFGREVVPADIEGTPEITMPESMLVTISVDQAQLLGLPANIPYKPDAYIGEVNVTKDGSVYLNGKRIAQPQIQALCADKK